MMYAQPDTTRNTFRHKTIRMYTSASQLAHTRVSRHINSMCIKRKSPWNRSVHSHTHTSHPHSHASCSMYSSDQYFADASSFGRAFAWKFASTVYKIYAILCWNCVQYMSECMDGGVFKCVRISILPYFGVLNVFRRSSNVLHNRIQKLYVPQYECIDTHTHM